MGERAAANREAFWENPKDPRHGTPNGYSNLGCGCDPCTAAWADYHLAYMRRHPEQRERAADRNIDLRGGTRTRPYAPRPERWRDLESA